MIKHIFITLHCLVTEVRGGSIEKSRGMSSSIPYIARFSPMFSVQVRCDRVSLSGSSLFLLLVSGCPLWQPTVLGSTRSGGRLGRRDVLPFVFRLAERCVHLSLLFLFPPSFSPFFLLVFLPLTVRRRLGGVFREGVYRCGGGVLHGIGLGNRHRTGRGVRHRIGRGVRHRLSVGALVVCGAIPPLVACCPTRETRLRLVTVPDRDLRLAAQGAEALGDVPDQLDLQGPIPRLDGCPPPHDVVGARHHLPEVLKQAPHGEVASVEG